VSEFGAILCDWEPETFCRGTETDSWDRQVLPDRCKWGRGEAWTRPVGGRKPAPSTRWR